VMDGTGKVLSLNGVAQSLFLDFALNDDSGDTALINGKLGASLNYIANQLGAIFGNHSDASAKANVPLVRMYSHRSGATLRLRGFASDLVGAGGHLTVLIELGEPENLLRKRLAVRYGLSPRQTELLMLLRRNAPGAEVAARLGAGQSALKSLARELCLKLELPDRRSLREFAQTISPHSMAAPQRS
jgi:DNA-binding CsgD family transcriptional regulator